MLDLCITGAFGTTNLTVITYEYSHLFVVTREVFQIYASVNMGISACNLISYSLCPLLVAETYDAHSNRFSHFVALKHWSVYNLFNNI